MAPHDRVDGQLQRVAGAVLDGDPGCAKAQRKRRHGAPLPAAVLVVPADEDGLTTDE